MSTELSGRLRGRRTAPVGAIRPLRGGPNAQPTEVVFTIDELGALRNFVADTAAGTSLESERASDLVVAVNELATNSICHGGGEGRLRIWREDSSLLCEVSDSGHIPLSARRNRYERPDPDALSGRGLWLVDHLCDDVQIDSSPGTGSSVRVHMRLP
jgi:anti-sigma regulatory factor (Ser/Thr protein kinase)